MTGKLATALTIAACSAAVVGCGSSSSKHSVTSAGGQASASSSTSASGNGEATKRPVQIVADAAAALRAAHGYVMQGTISQSNQVVHLKVSAAGQGSIDVAFSVDQASVELITVGNASFLRANRAFWTAHLGPKGATLADRWIQAQPSDARDITSSLGHFAPATLARCLDEDHGTLTVAGKTTVQGRPAVIIKDAGNVPGDSPGTLAVATTGPPYPLQVTNTGPQRAGGHIDVCNDGKAENSRGDLTLSQFGAVKPIAPPVKAIRPGNVSS